MLSKQDILLETYFIVKEKYKGILNFDEIMNSSYYKLRDNSSELMIYLKESYLVEGSRLYDVLEIVKCNVEKVVFNIIIIFRNFHKNEKIFEILDLELHEINKMRENPFKLFRSNILIVTDRLFEQAYELKYNLESLSNINILAISNSDEYLLSPNCSENIDFIVITGYLKQKSLYIKLNKYCKTNSCKIVLFAMLDTLIEYEMSNYKINFAFDRLKPPIEFINYLYDIHNQMT